MLVISRPQRLAFEASARRNAERRIFTLLREHYGPTSVWSSDEQASAIVHAAIDKAAAYGMHAARDAFKLAALMLIFGPHFDESEAWARHILAERSSNAPVTELLYRAGIEQIRERETQ